MLNKILYYGVAVIALISLLPVLFFLLLASSFGPGIGFPQMAIAILAIPIISFFIRNDKVQMIFFVLNLTIVFFSFLMWSFR